MNMNPLICVNRWFGWGFVVDRRESVYNIHSLQKWKELAAENRPDHFPGFRLQKKGRCHFQNRVEKIGWNNFGTKDSVLSKYPSVNATIWRESISSCSNTSLRYGWGVRCFKILFISSPSDLSNFTSVTWEIMLTLAKKCGLQLEIQAYWCRSNMNAPNVAAVESWLIFTATLILVYIENSC